METERRTCWMRMPPPTVNHQYEETFWMWEKVFSKLVWSHNYIYFYSGRVLFYLCLISLWYSYYFIKIFFKYGRFNSKHTWMNSYFHFSQQQFCATNVTFRLCFNLNVLLQKVHQSNNPDNYNVEIKQIHTPDLA